MVFNQPKDPVNTVDVYWQTINKLLMVFNQPKDPVNTVDVYW